MKKVLFALCALALMLTACKEPNKPINVDDLAEDGVYVFGEATGFDKVDPLLIMSNGINEAKDQTARDGMFEKYIVLQGGKEFSLVWVNAGTQTLYGANLESFTPAELTGIYDSNPATAIFKGKLETGDAAPKMKVATTGLYHIVLDLNKANDLEFAQILVAPANWGVRGGMNGWGFTEMTAGAASNDGMTFSIANAELVNGLEFKFAYGNAWKITLDNAGEVKANTNLGQDCKPGGANYVVETPGKYNISLTFKLAAGAVSNSFTAKIELGEAVEITAPENMYMIGEQWGNWAWGDEGVVELAGIPSAPGYFWCTRYFEAGKGFKFCAVRDWAGDFTGDGAHGYTVDGGNCFVAEDGFYTVFVNGNDKVVEVYPAEVYGIGTAWGADAWDYNAPDIVKFQPNGRTLVATVTNTDNAVRLASKIVPSAPIDGITTPNGWIDWWKTEFVYFDGKIAYRGAGGDQERVAVEAGQEITIDFNAGTVTVGAPFVGAITIDGDFADWADVPSAEPADAFKAFKVTNDERNFYFYVECDPGSRLWSGGAYLYLYFNFKNDLTQGAYSGSTGMKDNKYDAYAFMYLFGGSADAPVIENNPNGGEAKGLTLDNIVIAGNQPATSADIVKMEIVIPRANFTDQVAAGDVIEIDSYRSKDGGNIYFPGYVVK